MIRAPGVIVYIVDRWRWEPDQGVSKERLKEKRYRKPVQCTLLLKLNARMEVLVWTWMIIALRKIR